MRYNPGALSTRYTYTGQYAHLAEFGLYFYNARWYSPTLGRFAQADSVIPEASQGAQAWDRYGYVNNNPLQFMDPSGHGCEEIPEGSYARHQCEQTQQQLKERREKVDSQRDRDEDEDGVVVSFDTDEIVKAIPGTAEQWTTASQILDEIALVYDILLGIYVLTWSGIGLAGGLTFEGNPLTGTAGAAAGYIIGEGSVVSSNALVPGNIIASAATTAGLIGDMKKGNTSLEGSLSISSETVSLTVHGRVSSNALTSVAITTAGWAANLVVLSLPLQIAAVVNDRGWCSGTSIPVNLDLIYH